jgi:hypothetical protein
MKTIAFAAFGLVLAVAPAFAGSNCANRVHQVYKAPEQVKQTVAEAPKELEAARMMALLANS